MPSSMVDSLHFNVQWEDFGKNVQTLLEEWSLSWILAGTFE